MNVTGDSTDVTTYIALTLLADGTDATGLTITDLDLQYVRSGAAPVAKVDATALAATDSAHSDNKAIEIDATDQPGLYRVDWPDAAFAAGVKEVILSVKHTSCKTAHLRVTIDAPVNVTKFGGTANSAWSTTRGTAGTALPAAAADAAGGLPISDAGGLDLDAVGSAVTSGTHGNAALKTLIDAVDNFVDTEIADIQARLPAALVNSRMDCTIDGSGMETGAVDAILNRDASASTTNSTLGAIINDWEDAGRLDAILDARASQASVDTIDNFIDTEIAAIISTLGTPAGASLAADIAAIEAQTDDIGAAGAGLTAVPWNAAWDAEVQSEVTDALTTALTQGYRAHGAEGSVAQLLYEILAGVANFSISGTTKTAKKLDGTTAKTYTLDDATTPTAISHAS